MQLDLQQHFDGKKRNPNMIACPSFPLSLTQIAERRMRRHLAVRRESKQSGFTMIELLVVIVILGALALLANPMITEGQKMADTTSYYDTATRMATAWQFGVSKCQVSNVIGSSPVVVTPTAANHLSLLVDGPTTGLISTTYTACWNSSKVEPLNRSGVRGSSLTGYTFNGATVTIANSSDGYKNRVATTFSSVDDATVLELVQKYGGQSGLTALATSDTTDKSVQYGALSGGMRSVTIIK